MMESAYPAEDGRSVFDSDPKLKAKLDRELAKGKIPMEPTDLEEPIDGDLDMLVARAVEEVWKTYDPKNTGFMDKKNMEKFFKDALQLYALRTGRKSDKEVIPKGVNSTEAMKQAVAILNKSGTGRASRADLEDFLQTYDIEEALAGFLGKVGGLDVDMNKVTLIDVSQFQAQQAETLKPVYRDYPDD